MIKVAVLCFGDPSRAPSTIYRIGQYESLFNKEGISLHYFQKKDLKIQDFFQLRKYDAVINQKCILSIPRQLLLTIFSKKLIFDIDDSMWARPLKPFFLLVRWKILLRIRASVLLSDAVVIPSSQLKVALKANKKAVVIPMALDLKIWEPKQKSAGKKIRIGWSGSPVSFFYLEAISEPISELLKHNPNTEFWIYSGKKPNLSLTFNYVKFEPGTEPKFFQDIDIGLLPLQPDESALFKSPMKAIQYLASGIPVVGFRQGATCEILNDTNSLSADTSEEWFEALSLLIRNPEMRFKLASGARSTAVTSFDLTKCGNKWVDLIKTQVPGKNAG
jgi:glycosyltransferase involved in cell wall biosynthesis